VRHRERADEDVDLAVVLAVEKRSRSLPFSALNALCGSYPSSRKKVWAFPDAPFAVTKSRSA
jgi:hypothetical protein